MKAEYRLDPAHSTAQFVVRHMMITNVRGGFSGVQGTVVFDSENPHNSQISAEIDASTVNTNEPDRDKHLRTADFLDVEKFPKITFKSTKITPAGSGEFVVNGDLTMHGVTKPVVLNVDGPTAEGKDPWGNTRMGASATAKIKRSDFGLSFNATLETGGLLVGDDLKLEIEVSLIKQASAAA